MGRMLDLLLCTAITLPLIATTAAAQIVRPSDDATAAAPGSAATKPTHTAGAAEGDAADGPAPSFEEVPLFRLGGAVGLPAYLKASASTLGDEAGISAKGEIRTASADFATRNFTFDVVYRTQPGERSIFNVGLGGPDWQVHSRVHGPGHNGLTTFAMTGQPEAELGKTGDHAGPHLIRLQKRGTTLTFSLCVAFDGKTFEPTFSKTIPDLAAAAPMLRRHNSGLFVGSGNGGTIEAVRLIVEGKPVPTGRAAEASDVADADADASAASQEEGPLSRLSRAGRLPTYLKASGVPLATDTGLSAPEFRTNIARLLERDFTFDTVFRFKGDDEKAILLIGLGMPGGEGTDGLVFSRVHGPGHGGQCTFTIAGQPELQLGRLSHNAGPHLFRLEKRGKTLTMAISPDFDGTFDPVATKTLPDLRAAAPSLTSRQGFVFIKGSTSIEAVRLSIEGRPLDKARAEVAKANVAQRTTPTTVGTSSQPNGTQSPGTEAAPEVSRSEVGKVARRQTSIRGLTVSFGDAGEMFGGTTDLVLTATPGEAQPDTPVTFVTPVGEEMKLVLDDVLRSLRVRYPMWEADRVELTFDDRVSEKDGASIGAAVGTLLLSMLQGFEIDEKVAITGDVTADGKVRAIGGVVAKIRAATTSGAAIVALPADNYDQVADGLVYEGPALLSQIQVIGVGTLDEAAAAARVDRSAKLAEAVKLFAEVQASLEKSPAQISGKVTREKLEQVVALEPNHFSAKLLLLTAQGKQPRRLSSTASLYYMAVAIRGVLPALKEQALAVDRQRVAPAAVQEGLKTLGRLRLIADPEMQPLVAAYREFIRAVSDAQSGRGSIATVRAKARAVSDAEAKVNANRDVMEKMLREGV